MITFVILYIYVLIRKNTTLNQKKTEQKFKKHKKHVL